MIKRDSKSMKDNNSHASKVILLLGFPRSGTTWFSNLLNTNSNVCYRHELIGRNYGAFDKALFFRIKYDNGLGDNDYKKVLRVVNSALIDSDKAPFFKKRFGLHQYPRLHHIMWMATKAIPLLFPLYNLMFSLKSKHDWRVLIKETRSLQDMESIARAFRAKHILFLVRHPHGAISSNLEGIKKGRMQGMSSEKKVQIWNRAVKSPNLTALIEKRASPNDLTDIEFLAADWVLYNEKILSLRELFADSFVCFYDDFVEDQEFLVRALMGKLGLEYDAETKKFMENSAGAGEAKILLKDAGASYFSVYRNKSFDKDAWKNKLTEDEINTIDKTCITVYEKLKNLYKYDIDGSKKALF